MPLGCSESHERERRLFFSVNEGNWIALNLQEFHFQYIKKNSRDIYNHTSWSKKIAYNEELFFFIVFSVAWQRLGFFSFLCLT